MGKVGIVSCYFQKNYGSQLQAYATQKILDDWGVDNETINIVGLEREITNTKYKYFIRNLLNASISKDKIGYLKLSLLKRILKKSLGQKIKIREEMFEKFSHEMFQLSRQYNSKKDLREHSKNYATFLVGSDQLWLPSNIEADYYTLNFVHNNIPKISYATSFGVSTIPKRQNKKACSFLKRIEYISVREMTAQKIVKGLTGKTVPLVCDPTLLFTSDEWQSIQKPERIITEKYIFCYFLGNNPDQRTFAKRLKEKTGLKIVHLQHLDEYIKSDESFADYTPYNIGPSEFISLIRDAEFILTDSFHGTCFSILHRKKFFAFNRYKANEKHSTNSRIPSLLSLLNISNKLLITNYDDIDINDDIDYDDVLRRLDDFRYFSKDFLKNALTSSGIKI